MSTASAGSKQDDSMIDCGKQNILGVQVDAVDYEAAVERIIGAARERKPCSVSALAVHGVMTGVRDPVQRYRLNALDLVCPDGQPVRWAMRLLHRTRLPDRVYGPTLTLQVCARAAREGLPVYLYGSRPTVLDALSRRLRERFPALIVAGAQPSRFQTVTPEEKCAIADAIRRSGAALVLVGLGCPRQEVWVYEFRNMLSMPLLAVGAAFDFHAGLLPQAPASMQNAGLEWLYRLSREPLRLWRRYLLLNPAYLCLLALQMLKWKKFDPAHSVKPEKEILYA
jgi:N-acetylglucosaminyldiphosphoundecaprenol N-acetyl-beta-D-mannosaminyltransferase